MRDDELKAVFDQMAQGYDKRWEKMAPINNGLHYLLESVFAELPGAAHILCVGVGTGTELLHLASRFPRWHFTAVEPSCAMLEVCRQRVEEQGFTPRCSFHEGYLASLASSALFDGATCFLVSQFILEPQVRTGFFREIAERLKPDAVLASSDLAADVNSENYESLLRVWLQAMSSGGVSEVELDRMRAAYAKDVAIMPPATVASIIGAAGFAAPVQFYQAGLIHAWFARRASSAA